MFVSRTRNLLSTLALVALAAAGCAMPGNSPWGPQGCDSAAYRPVSPAAPGAAPVVAAPANATSENKPSASLPAVVIRGQSPGEYQPGSSGYLRGPQPVSGGAPATTASYPATDAAQPNYAFQPPAGGAPLEALPPPPIGAFPGESPITPAYPGFQPPSNFGPPLGTPTPLDVFVQETRTGRFMFGVAVNSDAGVTGQITIDEKNFDIARPPASWEDVLNGTAWRGAGQGFRIEAQPGSQVQRYIVNFTEPYFLDTNVSFSASGFYFDRNYLDWDESRLGGRLGWGYRLTPDLSVNASIGYQNVNIFNPSTLGVPELTDALGRSDLYQVRATLIHDTRDLPFMPTEGHLIEASFEQTLGDFNYPRGEAEYAQYFLMRERPDGSGRHTLAYSTRVGISGPDTPIFENYFAGGFSTLRGYSFRGASPIVGGVRVGGQFRWINTLEYIFPLTADDMIRGTVFCDFGTVEQDVAIRGENFRVAPGVGLRISVPALGPAPLAFDFAFPVHSALGDEEQTFSFFFGATR